MHLSRLGLLVHLVASLPWWGLPRSAGCSWPSGVARIDRWALTRAQGGWACTSARTSPTPFLFFLIGWLGGHGLALDWGWVLNWLWSAACLVVVNPHCSKV